MSSALYNRDILRLAASIPHLGRLAAPDGSADRRSPVCGSRIVADVMLDAERRVQALGLDVHACALGQASANLLASHGGGRSLAEVEAARDSLACWLAGDGEAPAAWPGLAIFEAARAHPGRHAAIRLPFEALADAIKAAG